MTEQEIQELVIFIHTRLAEDEWYARLAARAGQAQWYNRSIERRHDSNQEIFTVDGVVGTVGSVYGPHVARWSPGRVLAECSAKQALLKNHARRLLAGGELHDAQVLRLLASPYVGHEDYREEWLA